LVHFVHILRLLDGAFEERADFRLDRFEGHDCSPRLTPRFNVALGGRQFNGHRPQTARTSPQERAKQCPPPQFLPTMTLKTARSGHC
ncbi:MAG: hypothetical protein ABI377_01485, partial [Devosia sp.]